MTRRLWIKGGRLIDPALHFDALGDVHVFGDRVVGEPSGPYLPTEIIDASGYLVLPGLIDYHAHLFWGGTENGVQPDLAFLPSGITTAVDGGSAGAANYGLFSRLVIANSLVRIKCFLNVSSAGLATFAHSECIDPAFFDYEKIGELFRSYRNELLGLKVRQSKGIVGELGLKPLTASLKLAEGIGCPVAVHTTDPSGTVEEIADLLRPGDIYVHVFQGTGQHIIGADGRVRPAVNAARRRGVVFDAANGLYNFSFAVARAALAEGFLPDVISSDLTTLTWNKPPVYGLPYIMSKYLNMGLELPEVVAACTSRPAALMGMGGEIGTLAAGAAADIAIFAVEKRSEVFADAHGYRFGGTTMLVPMLTVRGGQVVFRHLSFGG